jgi:hypothetical protein
MARAHLCWRTLGRPFRTPRRGKREGRGRRGCSFACVTWNLVRMARNAHWGVKRRREKNEPAEAGAHTVCSPQPVSRFAPPRARASPYLQLAPGFIASECSTVRHASVAVKSGPRRPPAQCAAHLGTTLGTNSWKRTQKGAQGRKSVSRERPKTRRVANERKETQGSGQNCKPAIRGFDSRPRLFRQSPISRELRKNRHPTAVAVFASVCVPAMCQLVQVGRMGRWSVRPPHRPLADHRDWAADVRRHDLE